MAKQIERNALVPFSALQMYDLVNDVEAFPQFMDGCVGAQVLNRGDDFMEARLDLRKGGLTQSFATRNQLIPGERIDMSLLQGDAFASLSGSWNFRALGDSGCKVSLTLNFAFKNPIFALAAEPWFERVANQLVDSVCVRAKAIYIAK